jgi:MoxR-like ATPase
LTEQEIKHLLSKLSQLNHEIHKVIVGQEEVLEQVLISMIAGGHALLEGVPGLGKTLLVRTLASAVDLAFKRVQFTPDLMPTDILGTEVLEEDHATGKRFFKFNKGPVFANIVLADEINRTPPKTQAALLEAMQEFEVTYAGTTYPLPQPYFILATQNPIEQAGTYPLPEAQLDRFLLYIRIQYPTETEELAVLAGTTGKGGQKPVPVMTGEDILVLKNLVREVSISEDMLRWVNRIVRSTRPAETASEDIKKWVRWGAGPRAGQSLILTAKARALMKGRFAVIPEDITAMAYPVLRHRLLLNFQADAEGISTDEVVKRLLQSVKLPANLLT